MRGFVGRVVVFAPIVWLSTAGFAGAAPRPAFNAGRASFSVVVGQETCPYRVLVYSALPSEKVAIAVASPASGVSYRLSAAAGSVAEQGAARWTWTAPAEAGLHPLTVERGDTGEEIVINAFTLVPIRKVRNGWLEGYHIGSHPDVPLRDLAIYKPPRGFIRVTPELLDTEVSPHFRLQQFLCKQAGDFPKFLVLRTRLLLKLEFLLDLVNQNGYRCDTFFVMSGYRTPFYNRSIGNVKYSRHIWGGAADIFIDESPRDGQMDDLTGDGVIDWKDAAVLYDLVDALYGKQRYKPFVGGLGRYKKTLAHGPFIHVDVRGFRARWGT